MRRILPVVCLILAFIVIEISLEPVRKPGALCVGLGISIAKDNVYTCGKK